MHGSPGHLVTQSPCEVARIFSPVSTIAVNPHMVRTGIPRISMNIGPVVLRGWQRPRGLPARFFFALPFKCQPKPRSSSRLFRVDGRFKFIERHAKIKEPIAAPDREYGFSRNIPAAQLATHRVGIRRFGAVYGDNQIADFQPRFRRRSVVVYLGDLNSGRGCVVSIPVYLESSKSVGISSIGYSAPPPTNGLLRFSAPIVVVGPWPG
jgi:hypothetical protein